MEKNNHGGARKGAGRPKGDNSHIVSIRLSASNKEWYDKQKNKTQYINDLILNDKVKSMLC